MVCLVLADVGIQTNHSRGTPLDASGDFALLEQSILL